MVEREESLIELGPGAPATAVVISSPHSGSGYPSVIADAAALAMAELRLLEDGPTHLLGEIAQAGGGTLLAARFARAYVDLNRSPLEIDPLLLGDVPPQAKLQLSAKVQAGLGVVPSRVAMRPIYRRPIGMAAVQARLQDGYFPYHERLRQLVRRRLERFGVALLIDLHSMPGEAAQADPRRRIDVALGDRYGTSCDRHLAELAQAVLTTKGLAVARNRPYAGGFITEHYGRPECGVHALQLELARDLFMDPATFCPHEGLSALGQVLREVVDRLCVATLGLQTRGRPALGGFGPRLEAELPDRLRAAD